MRTVAHLRAGQVWHRLRYRLRRARWERSAGAIDAGYRRRAEALPQLRWDHPGLARVAAWRTRARPRERSREAAEDGLLGRFTFLGRSEELGSEVDWFRPDLDAGTRLWKTHLHEFSYAEDLARATVVTGDARYRERLFELARSWRAAAPIGCRDFALDAWNARAVATRLAHWAVAGRILGLQAGDPDADWLSREIAIHGLFLRDNLELDLRGNHLFRDAVGLVFAQELAGGVDDGVDWLLRVVAEQVLPDGAHEERAPLYHAICTQDLLEACLLLGDAAPDALYEALGRMTGFLEAIALGDGEIPLLGDAWRGEVPVAALLEAARALAPPVPPRRPERHSGLVPLAAGPWRLVVRAGPHAPDEQMGHAHADLLSFDASHGRQRIVTDTGTLLYDPGPDRQRIRGTAAHNTLRLDGQEQLEAWGSFRAGRRGRARVWARGALEGLGGTWQWVSASHDAWERLPGRPRHHRLVAVGEPGILVLDAVLGSGRHEIESHVHEHPDSAAPGTGVRIVAIGGDAEVDDAPLHEGFGETRAMRRHRLRAEAPLPWTGGWWIAPQADAAAPRVRRRGPEISVRLGNPDFALHWRPLSTDVQEAVSFCSASDGSAT